MHPTVPNQSHDSIGDDYAGHGEELGSASRPDGPPGRARSRKCGPLGAATIGTRSCPCQPKSAERTQRHASEWPNLSGRTITASAKLCVRLPISVVGLPRTQRLAPPINGTLISLNDCNVVCSDFTFPENARGNAEQQAAESLGSRSASTVAWFGSRGAYSNAYCRSRPRPSAALRPTTPTRPGSRPPPHSSSV